MIQALVFDLDDTLYLESDYVASGYRAVARHIAESFGCPFKEVFYTMMATFASQGRQKVLPVLIKRFLNPSISMDYLVEVYRQHNPKIQLFPGYYGLLRKLSRQYRLGIITDGMPKVQKRKVQTLRLNTVMDRIIYTWEYGIEKEKPHPLPFSLMMESLQADPEVSLFVGDNLIKDCRGAHRIGMKCAQFRHPARNRSHSNRKSEEQPDFVIDCLYQLPQIMQQII